VHKRIISAGKRVEFVSDTTSYIILRDRWCGDEMKDSFYEELGSACDKFLK
jgi:hypothetical protein